MNMDWNVRDYGAVGDGTSLDTAALQAAVDACALAGGGRVVFPPGRYLSGTLFLKSDVTLFLAAGSTLLASADLAHYGTGEENFQMPGYFWESLIFAKDCSRIGLEGPGTLEGQGHLFPYGAEAYSVDEQAKMPPMEVCIRPSLLYCKNCRDVTLRDVKLHNAAQFATLFENCQALRIENVSIHSRQNPNTDGFHIVSCRDIHISGCNLSCGDDAIVFNRSCENALVTNCVISSRWAGVRVGPHSSGTLRNIIVTGCIIHHTYGCALKLQMGEGGRMEDLQFSNLIFHEVTGPINVRLCHFSGWQEKRSTQTAPGVLRHVSFSNIRAVVAKEPLPGPCETPAFPGETHSAICIEGVEGFPVEDISLRDISLTVAGGGTPEEARGVDYPVCDGCYPEYFLAGTPPAHALFARQVRGLEVENLRVECLSPDARPAVLLDKVEHYRLAGALPGDREIFESREEAL